MHQFEGTLTSKLPQVGTTIFSVMAALANQHQAINLSQGFPDFDIDPALSELVYKYMRKGANQYAPMPGIPELREAIAAKMELMYNANYDSDSEVTITAGATQAIFTAISALIKEGDEVVIFTPAYDCYNPAIEIAGGKPVYVQLKTPDYSIDWEEVKRVVNRKTRMIVINTPHNPTGTVLSKTDLEMLESITKGTDILILSDEVYEHIIFEGTQHQSMCRSEELINRSIIVGSFGKTFHVTGWKMGYCTAPANIMTEFRKVHQFNVFSCNRPAQHAIADYIKDPDNYNKLGEFYQTKRGLFVEAVLGSRFKLRLCRGTYFQVIDYSEITDEKDSDFAVRLVKEHGIAAIPLSPFYHSASDDKALRFCFAKSQETIQRAGEILQKI